jgi:hypothetical protein
VDAIPLDTLYLIPGRAELSGAHERHHKPRRTPRNCGRGVIQEETHEGAKLRREGRLQITQTVKNTLKAELEREHERARATRARADQECECVKELEAERARAF